MRRSLFCCDTQEELEILKNHKNFDYIIATGRYSFCKEINSQGGRGVFLESNEVIPFEAAWNVLDQIHKVIDEARVSKYTRLFHFSYNMEGGFPTKVSQMIIHLNLIHMLVQNYGITEIDVFDNKNVWMINEALFLYAESRNIKCNIWSNETKTRKECLKTLEALRTYDEFEEDAKLIQREKEEIASIKKKEERNVHIRGYDQDEIGMLYCCTQPDNKHVDWLQRRKRVIGGKVRAICYYDTADVEKIRDSGIDVDCLEDYFAWAVFDESYRWFKRERKIILNSLQKELSVAYLGVDLSEWLFIKIRNYYYRELVKCLYMNVCAKQYFRLNHFLFIHMWGNTDFWETWLCYDNTRDFGTKLFKIEMQGFCLSKYKQPYQYMASAIFASTQEIIRQQFEGEYLGKTCLIRDVFWGENGCDRLRKTGRKRKKIALLPTGVTAGFTTYQFYYGTLLPCIEKLLDGGNEVIFKNHPGLNDCWERDVKQKFKMQENFTILSANSLVSDAIEQCDVVITDISSSAYDAASAGKAVFCIVDKQGYQLISWHKNGFAVYQDVDVMISDIEKVLCDENAFKGLIEKQSLYIEKLFSRHICMEGLIRTFLRKLAEEQQG